MKVTSKLRLKVSGDCPFIEGECHSHNLAPYLTSTSSSRLRIPDNRATTPDRSTDPSDGADLTVDVTFTSEAAKVAGSLLLPPTWKGGSTALCTSTEVIRRWSRPIRCSTDTPSFRATSTVFSASAFNLSSAAENTFRRQSLKSLQISVTLSLNSDKMATCSSIPSPGTSAPGSGPSAPLTSSSVRAGIASTCRLVGGIGSCCSMATSAAASWSSVATTSILTTRSSTNPPTRDIRGAACRRPACRPTGNTEYSVQLSSRTSLREEPLHRTDRAHTYTDRNVRYSAMQGVSPGLGPGRRGLVRLLRTCRRPGYSSGGGPGWCGPGRNASWCADLRYGRRSGRP